MRKYTLTLLLILTTSCTAIRMDRPPAGYVVEGDLKYKRMKGDSLAVYEIRIDSVK